MFDEKTVEIFSSRDKIRDQISEYTKEYLELEGIDLSKTSYLTFLINVLSALTANLLYYNTSTYREMFLTKAIQKESVLNLSAMLGYRPQWAEPATCSVLVGVSVDFTSDTFFVIPAKHKYYAGNIVFTQDNSIYVDIIKDPSGTISSVTVTEEVSSGGTRSVKHQLVSTNDANILYFVVNLTQIYDEVFDFQIPSLEPYEFHIEHVTFDKQISDIKVIISDEWSMYDSLFLIPFDEKGYAFRITESGGQISFGNGVIGKQPEIGKAYTITLSMTDGLKGNVISGSINKADKIYVRDYDPNGNSIDDTGAHAGIPYIMRPVGLIVVNTAPAYNGKDFPTLDEIRNSAIASVASMNRLVTQGDYDNIQEIIPELPVQHAVNIIKRSDLKNNEIQLFTDILFEDTIVPTRNATWILDSTNSLEKFIYTTDTIEIDGIEYYSMFNIDINPMFKNCSYYYLMDEVEKAVIINNTSSGLTGILPTYAKFKTITTDESGNQLPEAQHELDVELHYDVLIENADTDLQCIVETSWDGATYDMSQETIDDEVVFRIPDNSPLQLSTIENGNQRFIFKMYFLKENPSYDPLQPVSPSNPEYIPELPYLNESQVDLIIRDNLDDYMYSQVHIEGTPGDYNIAVYDVPVIKKSYYDIINQTNFTNQIYNKILTFDVINYRMLTDFVNLKFSNTTGSMDNMKYNIVTRSDIIGVNPTSIDIMDSTADGMRYLVSDDDYVNPWGSDPWNREPPFIAQYVRSTDNWIFEKISTNDIIYNTTTEQKVLYTGSQLVVPITSIPFQIRLIVWRDRTQSATAAAIISNIKTSLIDGLYRKFGFDKDIYMSEIIEIVQNVQGVSHCKLIEPIHDIFFNYDLKKDLTQQELLEYSPQLIWFDSTSISIEMR